MREGEVHRVVRRVRVERRLDPVGQVVRGEHGGRDLADRHALVGAADREPAAGELEVVDRRLEQVRRDRLGLLDHLVGGPDQRLAADHQRARAVGVAALGRRPGCRRAAPRRPRTATPSRSATIWLNAVSWPWPCGAGAGDDLDLAGRRASARSRAPSRRRRSRASRAPGDGARPHISVNVETPMPSWTGSPASRRRFCSARSSSYPNISLALRGGGLVVAGVVLQPGHRGERELLVLDPVLLADLERVDADLGGELVHHPLDGVRRLGPAGAAVGVGPGLVGEHGLAR